MFFVCTSDINSNNFIDNDWSERKDTITYIQTIYSIDEFREENTLFYRQGDHETLNDDSASDSYELKIKMMSSYNLDSELQSMI